MILYYYIWIKHYLKLIALIALISIIVNLLLIKLQTGLTFSTVLYLTFEHLVGR